MERQARPRTDPKTTSQRRSSRRVRGCRHRPCRTLDHPPLAGSSLGYRSLSYLIAADDGQTRSPRPISDYFWWQALQDATPDEAHDKADGLLPRPACGLHSRAADAADAGDAEARRQIGYLLAFEVDPPDLPAARRALEQAAAAGHSGALLELGVLLSIKQDPPDLLGARAAYEEAAAYGDTRALVNLGSLLLNQMDPPDIVGARAAFEEAAAAGNARGASKLSLLLATASPP